MKTAATITATVTLAATILAATDTGRFLFRFVQLLPGQDLTGHGVLYGALAFTVVGWGQQTQQELRKTVSAVTL